MLGLPRHPRFSSLAWVVLLAACGGADERDAGPRPDATTPADAGVVATDAAPEDTGPAPDAAPLDSGVFPDAAPADTGVVTDAAAMDADTPDATPDAEVDAGPEDTGVFADASADAGPDAAADAGLDAGADAGLDAGGDPDGAVMDAATPDAGAPDSGIMPDGGVPGVCTDGEEGCLCGFGGTCNDPALTCFNTSGTNVPPAQRVNVCIRECVIDAQCAASVVGNTLCRPVVGFGRACVSATRGEGETVDLSRRRPSTSVTGCQDGLFAFPPFAGSGLSALEDDQSSCVQPCNPAAAAGQPGACGTQFPYCNPNVLTATATPGVCTLRRAEPGDVCSRSSAVGICDTTTSTAGNDTDAVCLGVPLDLRDFADPSPVPAPGLCVQTCPLANPDCTASSDSGYGPATCQQFRAANTTVGFCSIGCSQFPSLCGDPGAFGVGSTCSGDLQLEPGFPFSFCRNVMTPVIAEWNWINTPADACLLLPGGAARCEANTVCVNDGSGRGVCVRLCDASAPAGASGCVVGSGTPRCDDTLIGTATDGFGACTLP